MHLNSPDSAMEEPRCPAVDEAKKANAPRCPNHRSHEDARWRDRTGRRLVVAGGAARLKPAGIWGERMTVERRCDTRQSRPGLSCQTLFPKACVSERKTSQPGGRGSLAENRQLSRVTRCRRNRRRDQDCIGRAAKSVAQGSASG